MRLGALLGPLRDATRPNELAEQARTFVGEGFVSLWSAQAVGRGFMLTDPLIALTVAASVTAHVELGTAVLQVPLYQPVDIAHRVFSLQQICGDRLLLGVGAGSTEKDFVATGRSYSERFASFAANMRTLRELFATGRADDVVLSPWPAVNGGPPLLLGSWGAGVERAARSYDGWIASALHRAPDDLCAALPRFRAASGKRAIVSTLQITAGSDLGKIRDTLQQFNAAGFDDAVVMILPGGPSPAAVRALLP